MYMLILWKYLQQQILLSTKFLPSFHKRQPLSYLILYSARHDTQ